jgi:hypothetical protein
MTAKTPTPRGGLWCRGSLLRHISTSFTSLRQGSCLSRWLKWRFLSSVIDFLGNQNGAMLFSGSLNLYGVVERGRLLNRQDRFSLPPFDIEQENASWSFHPDRLLVVGGYSLEGSRACIDRSDGRVHLFRMKTRIPTVSWSTLDHWLTDEIARLRTLFDDNGRRIASESETGPPRSSCVD